MYAFTDSSEYEREIEFPFAGGWITALAVISEIEVEAEVEEETRIISYGTSWVTADVKVIIGEEKAVIWQGKVKPSTLDTGKNITDAMLYDAISEVAEESFREHYQS